MTQRSRACIAVAIAGVALGFAWGVVVMHNHVFPYAQLQAAKRVLGADAAPENVQHARNSIFAAFAPKSDVVMVGDSLVEQGPWSEIFPGIAVANRGIGGDSTQDVLARMNEIYAVQAKKAFVMLGSNDVFEGRPVQSAFEDYKKVVALLASHGSAVIIQSTLECSRRKCGAALAEIRQLNELLAGHARQSGYLYVDINKGITAEEGLMPEFTTDGVHLNGKGYLHWSAQIRPLLASR
jgi:lysophospholipase L1-like esterase